MSGRIYSPKKDRTNPCDYRKVKKCLGFTLTLFLVYRQLEVAAGLRPSL